MFKEKYAVAMFIVLLMVLAPYMGINTQNVAPSESLMSDQNQTSNNIANFINPTQTPVDMNIKPNKISIEIPIRLPPSLSYKEYIAAPMYPNASLSYERLEPPINVTVLKLPYTANSILVGIKEYDSTTYESLVPKFDIPGTPIFSTSNDKVVSYEIHTGLDPTTLDRVKYLTIYTKPIYTDDNDNFVLKNITLTVTYKIMPISLKPLSTYDTLIITSEKLQPAAEQLAKLKEEDGYSPLLAYVEQINATNTGRDLPEKIRNYIKDIVSVYDIKYVIIFGDSDVVPARLAYIPDGAFDDNPQIDGKFVETDLYYADLDYTWDDNNDGLWGDLNNDKVDGVPDVFIGRIPVSNITEAYGVIRKIERYKPIAPMYSSVLFGGTDTFQIGYPEGEYLLEYSQKYIHNMSIVKLYESAGNLTRESFIQEINNGKYLVAFTGHGLPNMFALTFSQMYGTNDAFSQINKIYPILVALSCDAGRFAGYDGVGEGLVINPNGGIIAYFGSTRIAWGYVGELVVTGLMGEMFWRTIRALYNDSLDTLGQVWAQVIKEYLVGNPLSENMMGYYINWKTVAEYNLLGDPTLNKNMQTVNTTENITSIENTTANYEYTLLSGENMVIINSSVNLNTTNVIAGTLIVENSTLYLEDVILYADKIIIRNSNISAVDTNILADSIQIINSNLDLDKTVLTNTTMDLSSRLNAVSSSIELNIQNTTIIGWSDGLKTSLDLSIFGLSGTISNTFIKTTFIVTDGSLTIESSKISKLIAKNASITITNSTIYILQTTNVSIYGNNASIALDAELYGSEQDVILNPEYYAVMELEGLRLYNVTVMSWTIRVAPNANISLSGNVSTIYVAGAISINDSYVIHTIIENGKVEATYSKFMRIYGSGNITLYNSTALGIVVDGQVSLFNMSRTEILHMTSGYAMLNSSLAYSIYLSGTANLNMTYARVALVYMRENSSIAVISSRVAVVEAVEKAEITLLNATVYYWLRIADNTTLYAENSTVWMGLVYKEDRYVSISNLDGGVLEEYNLTSEAGWSIRLVDTKVLAWDLILYNSTAYISNSRVGWVYSYYYSALTIEDSYVMLVRATHNTTLRIWSSKISRVLLSGSTNAEISKSYIPTIYVLGHARLKLTSSHFGIVAGLAINSYINITDSLGGYIANIEGTRIDIVGSKAIIYVVLENTTKRISGIKPGYYSYWSSETLTGSKNITAEESFLAFSLDIETSKVDIRNSMVYDLYLMNSTANISDLMVGNFFVGYGASLNVYESNMYYALLWATEMKLMDSSVQALFIIDSQIETYDSVISPILYFLEGNYTLKLKPGYYKDANVSDFVVGLTKTSLRLYRTSVIGWYVFAIGLMGRVNATVVDSLLFGVGVAYNASLTVKNTTVYGYAVGIFVEQYNNTRLRIYGGSANVYLDFAGFDWGLSITGFKPGVASITVGDLVLIDNVDVTSLRVSVSGMSIEVQSSILEGVSISSGVGFIESESIIGSLTVVSSQLFIENVTIGSMSALSSFVLGHKLDIAIMNAYSSRLYILDSNIGIYLPISNENMTLTGLSPGELHIADDVLDAWNSEGILDADVLRWVIKVGDNARVDIISSNIARVYVEGVSARLKVSDSTISSVVLSYGSAEIDNSIIGLAFDVYAASMNLSGIIGNNKGNIEITDKNPFELRVLNSYISNVNITAGSSVVYLEDLVNVSLIILNTSVILEARNIDVLQLMGMGGLFAKVSNSWVRMYFGGIGSRAVMENTSVGIVDLFVYGNNTFVGAEGDSFINSQTNVRVDLIESEIIDYIVYASIIARVYIEDKPIFFVFASDDAYIKLINVVVQYPIEVVGNARIDILFDVEVRASMDYLIPVSEAEIKITRNGEKIYEGKLRDGKLKLRLYQAIITADERRDLGLYTIEARSGIFSGSVTVYVWKPMEITVVIVGPITILLLVGIPSVIILYFWKNPGALDKLKEKFRKTRKETNQEEIVLGSVKSEDEGYNYY